MAIQYLTENEIKEYYISISKNEEWGYLNKTKEATTKDGIDP